MSNVFVFLSLKDFWHSNVTFRIFHIFVTLLNIGSNHKRIKIIINRSLRMEYRLITRRTYEKFLFPNIYSKQLVLTFLEKMITWRQCLPKLSSVIFSSVILSSHLSYVKSRNNWNNQKTIWIWHLSQENRREINLI